jgi:hypothetical protein
MITPVPSVSRADNDLARGRFRRFRKKFEWLRKHYLPAELNPTGLPAPLAVARDVYGQAGCLARTQDGESGVLGFPVYARFFRSRPELAAQAMITPARL